MLSYPLPYYAACEILEKIFFKGKPETIFPTIWALDGELKVRGDTKGHGLVTVMSPGRHESVTTPKVKVAFFFGRHFDQSLMSK